MMTKCYKRVCNTKLYNTRQTLQNSHKIHISTLFYHKKVAESDILNNIILIFATPFLHKRIKKLMNDYCQHTVTLMWTMTLRG